MIIVRRDHLERAIQVSRRGIRRECRRIR